MKMHKFHEKLQLYSCFTYVGNSLWTKKEYLWSHRRVFPIMTIFGPQGISHMDEKIDLGIFSRYFIFSAFFKFEILNISMYFQCIFNDIHWILSYDLFLTHVWDHLWAKTALLLNILFEWLMISILSPQVISHMTQKYDLDKISR